ncbi:MAG TPA: cation diffusion facilitator family transporter [Gemmatimonadaceae bacterium]|nr:cation diffusion facilitator family transporter [Gemmatimonadaceae bacterium]
MHLDSGTDPGLQRRLRWALALTATFLVAEVVGGILANSLALLADAGHMLTDVAALALSLFVAWFSRQPAVPEKTYGYLRWEILAAFLNGAALLVVSGFIIFEAFGRLRAPEPVATGLMLSVATGGLLVNAACAWILHPLHAHSLNARGAYLHVLGDLLGSIGTVAAGATIRFTGWQAADPIASILVTLLIVRSSWHLVRESVDVLLEATPSHISLGAVRDALSRVEGVSAVHDLHVWTVTSGMVAMSAHAVVPREADHQRVLRDAVAAMREFGILHCTVQIEGEPMCDNGHP